MQVLGVVGKQVQRWSSCGIQPSTQALNPTTLLRVVTWRLYMGL